MVFLYEKEIQTPYSFSSLNKQLKDKLENNRIQLFGLLMNLEEQKVNADIVS